MVNPYLTEDNKPSDFLLFTLDYYGVSLEQFLKMSDEQVRALVKRFSDVLNDGKITKSKGHFNSKVDMEGHTLYEGGFKNFIQEDRTLNDAGSFSRYFDLDKWWDERIKELPEEVQKVYPFLIVPKASKSERDKGCENLKKGFITEQNKWSENDYRRGEGEKTVSPKGNIHPTVKPLKLMSYLITLGSRKEDLVLDPFVGSGTTCIAAKLLGRKYVGIDINREYVTIAELRLNGW